MIAIALVWAAVIVAVMVAVNRYRDGIEQRAGSTLSPAPPVELVVGRIQRNGFIRYKKERPL